MPFGDSITQGFNVAGGYRAPLFHLALAANRQVTFVGSASDYSVPTVDGVAFPKNHEGHGGWTIEVYEDTAARLRELCEKQEDCDLSRPQGPS
jgi:hypothetical protein